MGFLSKFRETTKRLTLPLLLASALAAGPRRATAADIQPQGVVAAAADNPGQYGTHWHTTVWAEQHLADDASLTLCAATNESPAEECQTYTLPRGVVVTIPNAWAGFSAAPPGGLVWRVDGIAPDNVALFSRTYTIAPEGAVGTLGQGIAAQRIDDLPIVGTSQYVPLLMREGFHANVGFLNATSAPSTVNVRIHTGGGNVVAEKTYSLPGYGWHQITDVYQTFGIAPALGEYAEVIQMTGEKLVVYGSVVDNTSGDPTTFEAKTRYTGQQQLIIPVAAHLPGYNNTTWLTDVAYLNASTTNQSTANFGFLLYNHNNYTDPGPAYPFNLSSGELRTFPDVLSQLFDYTNTKGSMISIPLDSHLIWSQTFNDRGAAGTFGQSLPAIITARQQLTQGLEGVLIGLSESSDSSTGYRSALGLVNTGVDLATFHLELYDDQGDLKGTIDQEVPPLSLVQLDKVYRRVTSDDIQNGKVLITLSQGVGFAYASTVDNQNGDATTEYATTIDRTGNHPPVFEGMDWPIGGGLDWGDADGDGYADVGIVTYVGDPTRHGRMVFSDPDGDNVTCTWSPGVGYTTMPAGFSTDNCDWSLTSTEPWQGYVAVTASDGRGGTTTIEQYFHIKNPQ